MVTSFLPVAHMLNSVKSLFPMPRTPMCLFYALIWIKLVNEPLLPSVRACPFQWGHWMQREEVAGRWLMVGLDTRECGGVLPEPWAELGGTGR